MPYRKFLAALACALAPLAFAAEEENDEPEWDVSSPPGDARRIDINTTTGTWMSLDVSPDGATVVFDLLGDIYRLPIAGGEARALDSGLSWSMQPRFSPDGSQIAYTSDAGGGDNIWIMQADGGDKRQLTKEDFRLLNNPAWSPDGNYIAARKHYTTTRSLGTGEIWLYHVNGGGDGVAVVEKPSEEHQKELGEPAFSPDGRYIYFSFDSTAGPIFQYAQDSNQQIFEIRRHDLEKGETESFVTGPGGAVRPEPSPDGRWLAFVRRLEGESALWLKDLVSGEERPIHAGLDQDLQEVWGVHGLYPNMDWMPDSRSIVFWAGGQIRRVDVESGDVTAIPFRVQDTREVFAPPRPPVEVAPESFDASMVRGAAVSPDGSRVVFEVTGRLYTKRLPDGAPRRLTSDQGEHFEYFPTWSPDGRQVAFITWDDQALGHVHRVAAGGGRSTRLTERPGHFRAPRYSPNGEHIVFEATAGGFLTAPEWSMETGVFIMPARGGAARRVTDDGRNPHFAGGNDRLYVTREGEDTTELVSIDLNGEAARTHARGQYLTRYEVAPDRRHLAYRENYHVYVVPLPPGGNPLELGTEVSSVPMTRASGDGGNWPHWSRGGASLHWSLGPTLFGATIEALFPASAADDADDAESGEGGYTPPAEGASMAVRLEAERPAGQVALRGARLVTMTGNDGGVIEDGVILTDGHRIAAVGARGEVDIPADAEVVDVTGKTIIPGLIDAHAHGSQGVGIIPQQNWIAYATLALGVTTVHDPSNDAEEVFAAAEMQQTGRILAPRIFSTGDIVYGARSTYFAKIDSLEDAREHVRRLKQQGAISIKNYNQPRRDQRQQVTTAAREENMLVVSEGGSLFHMDLSMVADGNSAIEHNLPQSMLYDDVLQFWRQTRVAYTPTLVVTYGGMAAETWWYQETDVWKHPILSRFVPPDRLRARSVRRIKAPISEYHHTQSAATAGLLADQGVLVSIGAHGQREGLASHWEMWTFVQGGMSPLEALRTATTAPAEALGFERDLGSLEAGKLADLVVVDGDILTDIRVSDRVQMVMLNGRLYDAKTLDETVTGNRRTEPFYWERERSVSRP